MRRRERGREEGGMKTSRSLSPLAVLVVGEIERDGSGALAGSGDDGRLSISTSPPSFPGSCIDNR